MRVVLSEEKKSQEGKLVFEVKSVEKYFPSSYTTKNMQEKIIQLLEQWQRSRQRQHER